jgi:RimJ/RimL family protein N-acetyltransferase
MGLEFSTERLHLRPWRPDDVDTILAIYSQWEVARYLGRTPKAMAGRADAEAALARWTALGEGGLGVWAIVPAGQAEPVGSLLLKELPLSEEGGPSGDIEIGWHLRPQAWGRGYATEAATRVLDHAWTLGLEEVFAVTYPENTPSQAVCLRIGMTPLGLTERYYDLPCQLFRSARP